MSENIKIWLYKNPAFKMLLLLTFSIIISSIAGITLNLLIVIVFTTSIISLILLRFKNIAYFITIFFAGIILSNNLNEIINHLPDKIIQDEKAVFKGNIKKIHSFNKKSYNIIATGTLDMKDIPAIEKTNIFITVFENNKILPLLEAGNEIFCNLNISFPQKKLLPNEFNENQFLKSNGIQWRGYTSASDFAIINNSKNLNYYRDYLLSKIKSLIFDKYSQNTASIAFAVVSGDKSFVDTQMREDYSLAGTAHLLAVSGLHTGLIASAIFSILFFIRKRWIKFIIFSICLIFFVFLSGIQPSAVRASAMIIIYMWMRLLERPVSPLNIISFVVILSILIEPSLVFTVGFQMSVFAVFGIIILYSVFYNKLKIFINVESKIQQYIITSISITLSATFITAPIVAYYFHIFTFSSVLSNLVSIPVFVAAVIFLLIGMLFSVIPFNINQLYFNTSDFLFHINNKITEFFAGIDIFIIHDNAALYYSIAFSLIILYLFTSNTLKHFVFRIVFTMIVLFFILPNKKHNEFTNGIYPRKDFVAFVSETKDTIKVMTIDRMKTEYLRLDYGLAKYLMESDKKIILGYSGDYGIKLNDYLKHDYDVSAYKLSMSEVNALGKQLNENVPQIIDIK